jgi:hypothetical protein
MFRSSTTGDRGTAVADRVGIEQPLERVRAGGTGKPVGVALAIAAALAVLIWQPWGRGATSIVPPVAAQTPAVAAAEASASAAPTPTPRPSRSSSLGTAGSAAYVSLVDNEWTVVALLASDAASMASTEEPSIQHGSGTTWPPGGPLLVLQQGLSYTVQPVEGPGEPDVACHAPDGPRYRTAVHLPAGRVAYLGVTFPGMNPRAHVTAAILDPAGPALRRVPSLVVLLGGMTEGWLYTVPSSGSGGTVLFAMAQPRILPSATYRFDVETPGIIGHRYLYACIGP